MSKEVTISYLRNGQLKEKNIPKLAAGRITMNFTSAQQPSAVEFKAFINGTNDAVNINGTDSLWVTPSLAMESTTAVIGQGSYLHISVLLHFFLLKVTSLSFLSTTTSTYSNNASEVLTLTSCHPCMTRCRFVPNRIGSEIFG